MIKIIFRAMMKQRKFGRKFLPKRALKLKIVELDSAENGDKLGMQGGRIFFYNDKENWWSRGGGIDSTPIGDPCGPDSEVFYDFWRAASRCQLWAGASS